MEQTPKLELKLVRTFLAVARHASFTRAAEELGLTQPAVSMHVHRLETAVGVPLVEIIGNRAKLTTAGELLFRQGAKLLGDAHRLEEQLNDLAGGARGRLRVGGSTTPGIYLLPRLLARFSAESPDVDISCSIGRTLQIEEMLFSDALDVALVGGHLASRELVSESWIRDEIVLVAGPTHPLAARADSAQLSRAELESARWIFHSQGSATRRCLETWLEGRRVKPRIAMELASIEAVKGMVFQGLGLAALSRFSLTGDHGLTVLPTSGAALRRNLSLVHHPEKARSPVVKAFRDLARTMKSELA